MLEATWSRLIGHIWKELRACREPYFLHATFGMRRVKHTLHARC